MRTQRDTEAQTILLPIHLHIAISLKQARVTEKLIGMMWNFVTMPHWRQLLVNDITSEVSDAIVTLDNVREILFNGTAAQKYIF